MQPRKAFKWLFASVAIIVIALFYRNHNPLESNYFPKCPVYSTTGIKCPGCGSQRAAHHLLNGQVANAFEENPLLILAIPYILFGMVIDSTKESSDNLLKWRKILFGQKAIFIVLFIIIVFCIYRNIYSEDI